MKKALRETQTNARWLYSKAEPKKISCAADPLPEDGQNLISWRRSLLSPTDPVWWRSMHAISSYRGNRPTNTHPYTNTQTNPQTGPITIHCAAKLSARCIEYKPLVTHSHSLTHTSADQPTSVQ